MNNENEYTIVMSWSSDSYITEDHDLQDVIYETSGDLFSVDENESRIFIGKFQFYYVDVDRTINEGESLWLILDAHSTPLEEYFEPIFGSEAPGFSNALVNLLDHAVFSGNLLVINRLELLPEYRRKGIGLKVLRHIITRFSSGAAVVAIKPYPLQFEASSPADEKSEWRDMMKLDQISTDLKVATEKLRQYYGKLGFLRLEGTPFMVRSTAWALPSVEEE